MYAMLVPQRRREKIFLSADVTDYRRLKQNIIFMILGIIQVLEEKVRVLTTSDYAMMIFIQLFLLALFIFMPMITKADAKARGAL